MNIILFFLHGIFVRIKMLILKKNLESYLVYQIDVNIVTDNIDNGSFEIAFLYKKSILCFS